MATIVARVFQNWRVSSTQAAFNQIRNASVLCKRLEFKEYGDPMEVITKVEEEISDELQPNEVGVAILIHAYLNCVRRLVYPVQPVFFIVC